MCSSDLLERTKLVNETTLLAYIRTGLYFLVAGSSLGHIVETEFWKITGPSLVVIGLIIMVVGIIRFIRLRKTIDASKKNIGESSAEFIKAARGNIDE